MIRRYPHLSQTVALLLVLSLPAAALGGKGRLAVVNMKTDGAELVSRAAEALGPHVGGWASQPSIAAFLAGEQNPGALPSGDVGQELTSLVAGLRAGKSSARELTALGRLLGVDYLLLLRVKPSRYSAKLYSVGTQSYAPRSFDSATHDLRLLKSYVKEQAGQKKRPAKKSAISRWWMLAAAAGLAGITIGLALSSGDDHSGDLTITVRR